MSTRIFLGAYTSKQARGIYELVDNQVHLKASLDNPTYLVTKDNTLYSIFGSEDGCGMAVYDMNQTDLLLKQKVVSDEVKGPCHISVDERHEVVVTTNYHEHCFHVYLKKDGRFEEPIRVSIDSDQARCHYSYYSNKDDILYVTDLGCDKIYLYKLEDLSSPFKTLLFPEGSGIRHCVFSKDESFMYVVAEHSGEIFVYKDLKRISVIKTNPNHDYNESMAAIRLTADEKHLLVSARNANQIIVYEIDEGYLKEIQRFSSRGLHPRDFNIVGDQLICANMNSDNLCFFNRNTETDQYIFDTCIDAPTITCVNI